MKRANLRRPETLDHHQRDLWEVLRKFIFSDGTLARIGGDTRVRYCYCQDYLLPTLLYAHDQFEDKHAMQLAEKQFEFISPTGSSDDRYPYRDRFIWPPSGTK